MRHYMVTGRYSPDHVSPEITHSANPLHQLLQQHPPPPQPQFMTPPPPGAQLAQHQQQFLQQFMSNSHARSGPPLPPQQPTSAGFAPPLAPRINGPPSLAPPMNVHQHQTMMNQPPVNIPSLPSYPVVRSVSAAVDGSRRNGTAGSSTSSRDGSPRRGQRPGARLSGENVEYRVRGEQQGESRSLEVMPITLYNSERTSPWGNLLSVSDEFISYPIRNGLIRVISQSSVERLLVRKHENHAVTELAFFNNQSNLLLSAGTDRQIAIWSIGKDPMTRELIKLISSAAQRVKWHPTDSNQIAIINGSAVFITDLTNVNAEGEGAENLYDISIVCTQTSSQINDMAFSLDNESVVTAGSDGFVHVYRLAGRQVGEPAEFIHRFEPFDGEPVTSLQFYRQPYNSASGLLISGENNTRLSLWNAPLHENTQPSCFQTVKLVVPAGPDGNGPPMHELLFDHSTQFLFVADRSHPLVYALHLAQGVSARSPRVFDNITEFTLAYPVLSMGILNRSQGGDNGSDATSEAGSQFSMQLYCLQTQAIQRYHVASSNCYLPLLPNMRNSIEDEVETTESFGQSVGAMTTEGENVETTLQAAAESPRATTAASSPETEIDVVLQDNGDDGQDEDDQQDFRSNGSVRLSAPSSPVRTPASMHRPTHIIIGQDDALSSIAGDEGAAPSLRSYARSSPSSSVRAYQDESSLPYEPSLDDLGSETNQTLLSYLRRMEVTQSQRDDQLREQMRVVMGTLGNHLTAQVASQVEKSIQKQLQTILVPAMGRIVLHTMENNFMKPVQTGFQRMITEKLLPEMESKIENSLSTVIPDQMDAGVKQMVQRVVEDVRQPVRESFRECFQDIIIPSFQAATQKMFEQINDTFVKGTRSAFESSGQSTSNAQVTTQLQELTQVVNKLAQKVDQLASVNENGIGNAASAPKQKSAEELELESFQNSIRDLVANENYEQAFQMVS